MRRALLRQPTEAEVRMTDPAQAFAVGLDSVSRHIRPLERAHLVRRQRYGRERRCPSTRNGSRRPDVDRSSGNAEEQNFRSPTLTVPPP